MVSDLALGGDGLCAQGVKGIALNLENENVGVVVFGTATAIKEGES